MEYLLITLVAATLLALGAAYSGLTAMMTVMQRAVPNRADRSSDRRSDG